MSFEKFIQKSPRSYSFDETTDTDLYDESFWSSCIGSYIRLSRKTVDPLKKKTLKVRRSSLAIPRTDGHPLYSTQEIIAKVKNENENESVAYMQVIISYVHPEKGVYCMVRVFDAYGDSIVDKWVTKDKAEFLLHWWINDYGEETKKEVYYNEIDKEKNCIELDEINLSSSEDSLTSSPSLSPSSLVNRLCSTDQMYFIEKPVLQKQPSVFSLNTMAIPKKKALRHTEPNGIRHKSTSVICREDNK